MLGAVYSLINLTEQLNAIREVSGKLKKHGAGAENLVTALQELKKTFDAIELELTTYLALDFKADFQKAREQLVALEGAEIYKQLGAARARSGKLKSIYDRELQPWFAAEQDLTDQERTNLETLFTALGDSDPTYIIPAMEEVSYWLTQKATETLTHLDKDEVEQAESDIRAARLEVLSLRQAMSKTNSELFDLEVQFTPGKKGGPIRY
jgi:hypothetical protein